MSQSNGLNMKERITLIVFSITTPLEELISAINSASPSGVTLCLSPHIVFDDELKIILEQVTKRPIFKSFYHYISETEMRYCDEQADKNIQNRFLDRERLIYSYYDEIKFLKNQIIYSNIKQSYEINACICLAEDLGIEKSVFTDNEAETQQTSKLGFLKKIGFGLRRIVFNFRKLFQVNTKITVLDGDGGPFYLLGEYERVTQYLDPDKYSLAPPSLLSNLVLGAMLKVCLIRNLDIKVLDKIAGILLRGLGYIAKTFLPTSNYPIAAPMHAHIDAFSWVAKFRSVPCLSIQDGYLPVNYSSAYLKYRVGVSYYLIWDMLSAGLFESNGLDYRVWSCFQRNDIPKPIDRPIKVRQVLFLASGAGDWTALKNRSDEDLAFLSFLDVAKEYKHINFIYRPHPLWVHPDHQGARSIERVSVFCQMQACENLSVSGGAILDAANFSEDGNLSAGSVSIGDDIATSDIIFGDHSQVLLTAAEKGKIVASVNCCQRQSFFYGHTSLGLPLLESSDDMKMFISNCLKGEFSNFEAFIESYNGR